MVMMLLRLLYVIHVLRTGVDTLGTPVYMETGENVTLNCSFEEKVQWLFKKKDSIELEEAISDNKFIKDEFSAHYAIISDETYNLQIINATHSNEGRYWCFTINVTDNESVQYFQLRLKDPSTLLDKLPPSEVRVINISKGNTIIGKEKENLTLACYTLGGIPRARVIWYHGQTRLTMNKDDSETAYYSLMINKNHNEQIYTCIAEHDMLKTPLEQSIKLNILYRPRVHFLRPKGPVSLGHNVNLSCEYYSNPLDAEILWTKNGQNIAYSHSIVTKIVVENYRKSKEIEIMFTDAHGVIAIIIANVTKEDAGAYTCNATNTEGSASETVYLAVQDNGGDTITDSVPPYSGTSVKGFVAKEQILYGVFIVLLVLVLIIISLVVHVYIRNRCKQTNYAVPQREVVRHSPIEIEMQEESNNESRVHEESRNLPILSAILQDLQNTTSGDSQSDLSKTNTSQSSSSLSNRSQNINEEDYLHPYHGFVNRKLDVHEYDSIDATENEEYEESINTSKHKSEDYENLRL